MKKKSIKNELLKIVRKKVSPSCLEELGIASNGKENLSVLSAIALAQVKKGLEGDLKAAMFIEGLINNDEKTEEGASSFDVVVKVVGEENGA